jgi:hypothetical protein
MLDGYIIEGIKKTIGETGYLPEEVTGMRCNHQDNDYFKIMMYDCDVEFEKKMYRVVLVEKWIYDSDDLESIDHVEELSFDAWEL